jgi:hypothetical protein
MGLLLQLHTLGAVSADRKSSRILAKAYKRNPMDTKDEFSLCNRSYCSTLLGTPEALVLQGIIEEAVDARALIQF